ETMLLPSGENDALVTPDQRGEGFEPASGCEVAGRSESPIIGLPIGWPVAASHTRKVLSAEAETMRLPSRENDAPLTAPVCPLSGSPIGWPVAASHMRKVSSCEAVTMSLPSGENDALV